MSELDTSAIQNTPDYIPRILIVDDNPDNSLLLSAGLDSHGYLIESVDAGASAIDYIYATPPDLVLLDVMMPGMSGIDVVKHIKNDASLPFIPIVLVTALDTTNDIVDGLDAGADDYIVKPINFRELNARVKSLLRIKALQRALTERERELSLANDRLLLLARVDGLTAVDSRRYLDEQLHDMWQRAERLREPLSIVMCDIDHFKKVNDEHGHQVGDTVLKQFAAVLKSESRAIDRIGRYGGEEFLTLLPGTPLEAALSYAERARRAVEQHPFTGAGATLHLTMSCGVAGYPHPEISTVDTFLEAADSALYVAKKTGRNRVIRFDHTAFHAHTKSHDA